MTNDQDLMDRLARVNPIPDPNRIYEDREKSLRLSLRVQQRRESAMTDSKLRPVETKPAPSAPRRTRLLAAGAAAGVLAIAIVGAVLLLDGGGGDDVFGDLPLEVTTTATCGPQSPFLEGQVQECDAVGSHPSVEGTERWTLFFDPTEGTVEGDLTITNAEGSWTGRHTGTFTENSGRSVATLIGEGAYEGYQVVFKGEYSGGGTSGVGINKGTITEISE